MPEPSTLIEKEFLDIDKLSSIGRHWRNWILGKTGHAPAYVSVFLLIDPG